MHDHSRNMTHYHSLGELHRATGLPPLEHPLLSLLTCQELAACPIGNQAFTGDFYLIMLKKMVGGQLRYGKTRYDHQHGSMFFVKPRQVVEILDVELAEKAFVIFVHEDFLSGHPLHAAIRKLGFFEYEANEALHLSAREEHIMWALYEQIGLEYGNNPDEYSREIMLSHLDSLLKYAQRFYKRQFLHRAPLAGTTATRFTAALSSYRESGRLEREGLPTVQQLAAELHTSPRYLSDLLKQETGETALGHIHRFLLGEAKNLLLSTDNTVAQTAYALGFDNPPYFSRLFKKEVGLTPQEYRAQFLN